jgi:hypothetical protein
MDFVQELSIASNRFAGHHDHFVRSHPVAKVLEKQVALQVRSILFESLVAHYLDSKRMGYVHQDIPDAPARLTADLNEFSTEAGLKYFILGALSSGLLLFGESLLYGFTGLTNFEEFLSKHQIPFCVEVLKH